MILLWEEKGIEATKTQIFTCQIIVLMLGLKPANIRLFNLLFELNKKNGST